MPAVQPPDPGPRRPGPRAVAAIVVIALGLAVLTPFGWADHEPQYSARVGTLLRFGPRPEDLALRDSLASRDPAGGAPRFRAGDLASVPPGLVVNGATGTLDGTPSMPGTYTLALAVEDGRHVVAGRGFRIKVLPPSH